MKTIFFKIFVIITYFYSVRLLELGSEYDSFPLIFYGILIIFIAFIAADSILHKKRLALLTSFIIGAITVVMLSVNLPFVTGYSYDINDTKSNFPTITSKDYVVSKHFNFKLIKGVMYAYKNKEGELFRKRLIAKPGDEVQVCGDSVYVNGYTRTYLNNWQPVKLRPKDTCRNKTTYYLMDNQYFFVGDNLLNSLDSRHFGPIKSEDIIAISLYKFQLNESGAIIGKPTNLAIKID